MNHTRPFTINKNRLTPLSVDNIIDLSIKIKARVSLTEYGYAVRMGDLEKVLGTEAAAKVKSAIDALELRTVVDSITLNNDHLYAVTSVPAQKKSSGSCTAYKGF